MSEKEILKQLEAESRSGGPAGLMDLCANAAALIRSLRSKLDLWEAMAKRDMQNSISREVETIFDRDVRAAMHVLLSGARPGPGAELKGELLVRDASFIAEVLAGARAARGVSK